MADYVSVFTYKNDVSISFEAGNPKVMALREKLEALCPDAYMNGYLRGPLAPFPGERGPGKTP